MRSLKYLFFALILATTYCNSQTVINAETLRVDMLKGKANWAGSASFGFGITKNTDNIVDISTNIGIGYNGGKNLWMIISNLNFNKSAGTAFKNSGSQHFRYNREVSDRITLEAFLQGQYDRISNIDFRGLAGFGSRFDFSKHDNPKGNRIFFGASIMYEYEKSSEVEMTLNQKDFRSSNYLSFTLNPTNGLEIVSTTYYQPRLDLLKDYRISSDVNIEIKFRVNDDPKPTENSEYVGETKPSEETKPVKEAKASIWDKLSFTVSFVYNYDAFPVSTIPKTQYSLSNGIKFSF